MPSSATLTSQPAKEKLCIKCGVKKPMEEFGDNWRSPDGHAKTCMSCDKRRQPKEPGNQESQGTEIKQVGVWKALREAAAVRMPYECSQGSHNRYTSMQDDMIAKRFPDFFDYSEHTPTSLTEEYQVCQNCGDVKKVDHAHTPSHPGVTPSRGAEDIRMGRAMRERLGEPPIASRLAPDHISMPGRPWLPYEPDLEPTPPVEARRETQGVLLDPTSEAEVVVIYDGDSGDEHRDRPAQLHHVDIPEEAGRALLEAGEEVGTGLDPAEALAAFEAITDNSASVAVPEVPAVPADGVLPVELGDEVALLIAENENLRASLAKLNSEHDKILAITEELRDELRVALLKVTRYDLMERRAEILQNLQDLECELAEINEEIQAA